MRNHPLSAKIFRLLQASAIVCLIAGGTVQTASARPMITPLVNSWCTATGSNLCTGPFDPAAINDAGQILGQQAVVYSQGVPFEFILSGNNATFIPAAEDGLSNLAMNDRGQAVSVTLDLETDWVVLYSNGQTTAITTPLTGVNNSGVYATGISSNGTVLILEWAPYGINYQTYLYLNGNVTNISNAAATLQGEAISPNATVAGLYTTPSNANHLFVYSNGKMTDLGPVGSPSASFSVVGINNAGQIVGNENQQASCTREAPSSS
jgi:probable HAF family extracellular repeat protein